MQYAFKHTHIHTRTRARTHTHTHTHTHTRPSTLLDIIHGKEMLLMGQCLPFFCQSFFLCVRVIQFPHSNLRSVITRMALHLPNLDPGAVFSPSKIAQRITQPWKSGDLTHYAVTKVLRVIFLPRAIMYKVVVEATQG